MSKATCEICKTEHDTYWMHEIPTGRRVQYICDKCFREGERQADYVTFRVNRFVNKERENKR